MSLLNRVSQFLTTVQLQLFPILEEEGPLTDIHKRLINILEIIQIEKYVPTGYWLGRPAKDRCHLARAYIAMVVLKLSHVNQLIDYLKSDKQLRCICGWNSGREIPSESKFCRVFKEFAEYQLPARAHQLLIEAIYDKELVMHLTKDSVPIEAREKSVKKRAQEKPQNEPTQNKKKGRPRLGEKRIAEPKTRLEKQVSGSMSFEDMLQDLPKICDYGAKTSPKGYKLNWKGYKLHTAVDDYCIPISVILTSASTHDSQVAIPLAIQAHDRVDSCYDLMDSAYNIKHITDHSRSLGHVPIVGAWPKNTEEKQELAAEEKRKKILGFETAEARRYKLRAKAERFNALFKDHYGGSQIRVRGHKKVFCQVMFSVVTLTAAILLDLVT
jgi:DDE family transposase/transposase-like protein DUF772